MSVVEIVDLNRDSRRAQVENREEFLAELTADAAEGGVACQVAFAARGEVG